VNSTDFVLELSRVGIELGLAVWIGGTLAAFLTGSRLFAMLPSRAAAGEILGAVLDSLDRAKFTAAGALLIGVLLEVQTAGSSLPGRRIVRACVLFVLIASHVYSVMVVKPRMRYYRERIPDLDAAPSTDPWRMKFQTQHKKSEGVAAFGFLLSVAALVIG
jgi:hypothetical protein